MIDLLSRGDIVKIGFGLSVDFMKMEASYPKVALNQTAQKMVVDLKEMAITVYPEKAWSLSNMGLSALVRTILGVEIDKTMQCSDWEERPLKPLQYKYAAIDVHSLCCLFDRLVAISPGILDKLDTFPRLDQP